MKKVIIFRQTAYCCDMRRKQLGLKPSECILLTGCSDNSRIKGYWKEVMIDETIKLDGMTKEGFQRLYMEDMNERHTDTCAARTHA